MRPFVNTMASPRGRAGPQDNPPSGEGSNDDLCAGCGRTNLNLLVCDDPSGQNNTPWGRQRCVPPTFIFYSSYNLVYYLREMCKKIAFLHDLVHTHVESTYRPRRESGATGLRTDHDGVVPNPDSVVVSLVVYHVTATRLYSMQLSLAYRC
jgi:hypothetical protein